jgi:hypothetical protein
MYKYNIHTNSTDLGASVSVSEIDGLEKITTAEGRLSLSGADVDDVGDLVALGTITAQSLIATIAKMGSATIDTLTSTLATIGASTIGTATIGTATIRAATIDALTSTTAHIQDLFTTNLNLVTLTVRDLYATLVQIDGNLTTYGNASFSGDTFMNRDASVTKDLVVGGSVKAGNIIRFTGSVRADSGGEYRWDHAPLISPITYFASLKTNVDSRPSFALLAHTDPGYSATWIFWFSSAFGWERRGDLCDVNFLAIGS